MSWIYSLRLGGEIFIAFCNCIANWTRTIRSNNNISRAKSRSHWPDKIINSSKTPTIHTTVRVLMAQLYYITKGKISRSLACYSISALSTDTCKDCSKYEYVDYYGITAGRHSKLTRESPEALCALIGAFPTYCLLVIIKIALKH